MALLSKLQLCCRLKRLCGVDFSLGVMYGCVPLPLGEGGAERRVRVWECVNAGPHPAVFLRLRPVGLALRVLEASPCRARASRGHLLPSGEGHAFGFFANLDNSASMTARNVRGRGRS